MCLLKHFPCRDKKIIIIIIFEPFCWKKQSSEGSKFKTMVIYVYIYIKVLFFGSCITGHLHKNKLLTLSHSADQEVPGMKQVVKTKHPSKSAMKL